MIIADFIDLLNTTDIIKVRIWLEEWQINLADDEREEIKVLSLTREFIIEFAKDIASQIWLRLSSICTDALYNSTKKAGHDFLKEIYQKAVEQNIEVRLDEIDSFLTPSELMESEGLATVNREGLIRLTKKGEKAARQIQSQLEE